MKSLITAAALSLGLLAVSGAAVAPAEAGVVVAIGTGGHHWHHHRGHWRSDCHWWHHHRSCHRVWVRW